MKPIISKTTEAYLKQLEKEEKQGKPLESYQAYPDAIDQLINEDNLHIQRVFFDTDLDLMLVVLSNRKILKESISQYKRLRGASLKQLQSYEISPMGIHWSQLDEDLSLKGFLEAALYSTVHKEVKIA